MYIDRTDMPVTTMTKALKTNLIMVTNPIEWENFEDSYTIGDCVITITGNNVRKETNIFLHAKIVNTKTNDEVTASYGVLDRKYDDKSMLDIENLMDWCDKLQGTAAMLQN